MQKAILIAVSVLCISVWGTAIFFFIQGNQEVVRGKYMSGHEAGLEHYEKPAVVLENWNNREEKQTNNSEEIKVVDLVEQRPEPRTEPEEVKEDNTRRPTQQNVLSQEVLAKLGSTEAVSIDNLLSVLNIETP